MRRGEHIFDLRNFTNLAKLCLVLLLIHFSQVYPYAHFHHSHVEADEPADFHHHVVADETHYSHDDHHAHDHGSSRETEKNDGHDHHHEYTLHVDWHLVRPHSNGSQVTVDSSYISSSWSNFSQSITEERFSAPESIPIPDSALTGSTDSRAPPRAA